MNELQSYRNQSLQGHFQNYTAVMQEVNIIHTRCIGNYWLQSDFCGMYCL